MALLHEINRGSIKIYLHQEFGLIAISDRTIGFELTEKIAAKYCARIPNINELNQILLQKNKL